MLKFDFNLFNIVAGRKCTLKCVHCVNSSGPDVEDRPITDDEITAIIKTLNTYIPKEIFLTGGEPTLYIKEINQILTGLTYSPSVLLTTNGDFATSQDETNRILSSFSKLDRIQLSFDRFHGKDINSPIPNYLMEYANVHELDFSIAVCLKNPTDLIFAKEVESKFKCKVIIEKITGSGRAAKTNSEFTYQTFDQSALNAKCPNKDSVTYIAGRGFTTCCSNTVFNLDSFAFHSFDELIRSNFYNDIQTLTFGEQIKKYRLENKVPLTPRMSTPCNLCEAIWRTQC